MATDGTTGQVSGSGLAAFLGAPVDETEEFVDAVLDRGDGVNN